MSFKSVFFTVIGAVVFGLILFAVGGLMMPRTATVMRSIDIKAPASFVFPYINVPRNFTEWSPWARYDSKIFYSYEGPKSGKGAALYWASDHEKVGSGSQTITYSEENKEIKTALRFGDSRRAEAGFVFIEEDGLTTVIWNFSSDFGYNFGQRYFGPFMDKQIGPEYEVGLLRLKKLVETEYIAKLDRDKENEEQVPTQLLEPQQ